MIGSGKRQPHRPRHRGQDREPAAMPSSTATSALATAAPPVGMQRQQSEHVQRHAIGHRLQQRSARPGGMESEAGIKNESGKNQRVRPAEKCDRGEAQICQHNERKYFELPEVPFVGKHQPRKMKQRQRNDQLRRQQAPGFVVVGLADYANQRQTPSIRSSAT